MPYQKDDVCYAGYPKATLYVQEEDGTWKKSRELLWGDWMEVTAAAADGWLFVRARGMEDDLTFRVKEEDVQKERLLEVTFVDIGQGDGALIRTPDDQHIILDAGQSDNMYRFLRWKYNFKKQQVPFKFTGIISHSDLDHYKGFEWLFEDAHVRFSTIYHNGIIEDTSKEGLGGHVDINGRRYVDEIIQDTDAMKGFLNDRERWVGKTKADKDSPKVYGKLLNNLLESGRVDDFQALNTKPGEPTYLPGYEPGSKPLEIRVLGPVLERNNDGEYRLRWFGATPDSRSYDKGKTKNGHSVILQLKLGGVKVLLGGDLNTSAGVFLLEQYGNSGDPLPGTEAEMGQVVDRARAVFQSDVAKSCHHGSHDVPDELLRAFNAAATVISSGDNESHAHPRCDTLGAIGLYGRGRRPLIFSTELARSARESSTTPEDYEKLKKAEEKLSDATTEAAREKASTALEKLRNVVFGRAVEVYGAINLRTDGKNLVMAYRKEKLNAGWDIYCLEPGANGLLEYKPDVA